MDILINQEELDKLSLPDAIALEAYFDKILKVGHYSGSDDIEYCIKVKHELRSIIMEWTALTFEEK